MFLHVQMGSLICLRLLVCWLVDLSVHITQNVMDDLFIGVYAFV